MLLANVVGVAFYLWGASHGWTDPVERAAGIHSVAGEPLIWAGFVFPIWAVFAILNLIWLVIIGTRKRFTDLIAFAVICPAWVVAIIVDFSQH
jgi:hypothetical protein